MPELEQANSLSITRDFEAEYHCGDWGEPRVVVGERTGRDWLYFEGDSISQQVRVPREEMLDPMDWR